MTPGHPAHRFNSRKGVLAPIGVRKRTLIMGTAVATLLTLGTAGASNASDDCTPADAYTETVIVTKAIPATDGKPAVPAVTEEQPGWQRYSWTGGPVETAPAFPGDGWQANTASDPHGIGVEGAYDLSHGSSGNADWFYLQGISTTVVVTPEVPAVPGKPAVPAVTDTVRHDAVTCETDETTDKTETDETAPRTRRTRPTPGTRPPTRPPTEQDRRDRHHGRDGRDRHHGRDRRYHRDAGRAHVPGSPGCTHCTHHAHHAHRARGSHHDRRGALTCCGS